MLKSLSALVRGRAHERVQSTVDAHAVTVLRQQIRDAAMTVKAARHAVAVAMAQARAEEDGLKRVEARITDLEARTFAAMKADRNELAQDGAEAIAALEEERDRAREANQRFDREIARLRTHVAQAEERLRRLKRGRDLAAVTERTQAMAAADVSADASTLQDAEETLERLRKRQIQRDYTNEALVQLDDGSPDAVTRRLREAGCGPTDARASDVLERLKAKRGAGPVRSVS